MKIREKLGIIMALNNRGKTYTMGFTNLIVYSLLLASDYFPGFNPWLVTLGIFLLAMSVYTLYGLIDYKKGIWKSEAKFREFNTNPVLREMYDDIKEIRRELNEQKGKEESKRSA